MVSNESNDTITINATDVTGQRRLCVQTRRNQTIDELTAQIRSRMSLHAEDREGRPVSWDLRHESKGQGLNPSQIVGETLRDQDMVRVQPKISAGGEPRQS